MRINSLPTAIIVSICLVGALVLLFFNHAVPSWLVAILVGTLVPAAGQMQPAFRRLRAKTILPASHPDVMIKEKIPSLADALGGVEAPSKDDGEKKGPPPAA